MLIRCPGCGGRNPREAQSCDWCHRPFVQLPRRGLSARWWGTLSGIVLGVLVLVVALLALLNASRLPGRASVAAPLASPSALPAVQVTSPIASAALPTATQRSEPAAEVPAAPTPTPAPSLTPTPAPRTARITNTNGLGANIRRAPATSAQVVTVAPENSVVRVLGGEQQGEGRVWRQVEDSRGNQGWLPADFLAEAPAPTGR